MVGLYYLLPAQLSDVEDLILLIVVLTNAACCYSGII